MPSSGGTGAGHQGTRENATNHFFFAVLSCLCSQRSLSLGRISGPADSSLRKGSGRACISSAALEKPNEQRRPATPRPLDRQQHRGGVKRFSRRGVSPRSPSARSSASNKCPAHANYEYVSSLRNKLPGEGLERERFPADICPALRRVWVLFESRREAGD